MRRLCIEISVMAAIVATCVYARVDAAPNVQRFGSVIGLNAEKMEYYKKLHADAWPEVLKTITECNIRKFSIYMHQLDDDKYYLFSYFEYIGDDFAGDMSKMAADPMTQKWWKETDPCQFPVKHRKEGEKWASMEEVFHLP